ncbi:MAG: DUF1549 domain-containing protein [Armatimonadota bacterium]
MRPLLLTHCISCHGPQVQQGGLRLDSRAALLRGGERGPALSTTSPAESLLLRAVRHEGPAMPPDRKLAPHEIAALEKWIGLGAPFPSPPSCRGAAAASGKIHWAFRPVRRPVLPAVKSAKWPLTPIDRFILAKLEAKRLQPAPAADRRTLIRRATLDLTGLLPTPAEVRAFLADRSTNAWEKVIDRLLASPLYGERWGRHWLDVVRYADTAGETADYPVPEAYRYRNYVIRAFNRDLPYDQFLREQLAGDILARQGAAAGRLSPERYAELVTATGFVAISRRFGYDTERYEHLTIQDSIDGVGQAVLGLSLGCARCHDHKFDPISAVDYYGLYGIFASTRYAFPGSERLPQVRAMVPLVPERGADPRWRDWDHRVSSLQERLGALKRAQGVGWSPTIIRPLTGLDGDFELQARPQGGSLGLPANPWVASGGVLIDDAAQSSFTHVYSRGASGAALASDGTAPSLGRGWVPAFTDRAGTLHFALDFRMAAIPAGSEGSYRVYLGSGPGRRPALEVFLTHDALFARNGDAVEKLSALEPGAPWHHLQLALDLPGGRFTGSVGTPGRLRPFRGRCDSRWDGRIDYLLIDSRGHLPGLRPTLHVDNVALSEAPLPPLPDSIAMTVPPTAPAAEEIARQAAALEQELAELLAAGPFPQAYAVWEGTPRDVPVQKRGEPEQPGDVAARGFPKALGGTTLPPGTEGSGRLELARWLTRPQHPLTARVLVNRVWQHHFGTGLVTTENDFGTRGRRPSHPELLDYLASVFAAPATAHRPDGETAGGRERQRDRGTKGVRAAAFRGASAPSERKGSEFIPHPSAFIPQEGLGWSLKRLHRLILLSRVYQLSSSADAKTVRVDPGNEWLARFPRQRVEAEALRDNVLLLGGTLDLSTPPGEGGRHPFPPVRQALFSQHAPFDAEKAVENTPENAERLRRGLPPRLTYDTDRRSVYLMTQRIRRHPFLALFDGPDTNASTARRTSTTVPTQALYLMNAPFVHEQSEGFARRMIAASAGAEGRIRWAYEMALTREPSPEELREELDFVTTYQEKLQTLALPAAEREVKVWAAFARTLFGCNEFLHLE